MKQKLVAVFSALILAVSLVPVSAFAQDENIDEGFQEDDGNIASISIIGGGHAKATAGFITTDSDSGLDVGIYNVLPEEGWKLASVEERSVNGEQLNHAHVYFADGVPAFPYLVNYYDAAQPTDSVEVTVTFVPEKEFDYFRVYFKGGYLALDSLEPRVGDTVTGYVHPYDGNVAYVHVGTQELRLNARAGVDTPFSATIEQQWPRVEVVFSDGSETPGSGSNANAEVDITGAGRLRANLMQDESPHPGLVIDTIVPATGNQLASLEVRDKLGTLLPVGKIDFGMPEKDNPFYIAQGNEMSFFSADDSQALGGGGAVVHAVFVSDNEFDGTQLIFPHGVAIVNNIAATNSELLRIEAQPEEGYHASIWRGTFAKVGQRAGEGGVLQWSATNTVDLRERNNMYSELLPENAAVRIQILFQKDAPGAADEKAPESADVVSIEQGTNEQGDKTETTTYNDGSTTVVTTKGDGSTVTESTATDGSTSSVDRDDQGNLTDVDVWVPNSAADRAHREGRPVDVPLWHGIVQGWPVHVQAPEGAWLRVPVEGELGEGYVVVVVDAHGNVKPIGKSVVGAAGARFVLADPGARIMVMDNKQNFPDVEPADWFAATAAQASARGLITGVQHADGTSAFDPNVHMNRGMVATVLMRLEQDRSNHSANFSDVSPNAWYADGVAWAADCGIVTGIKDSSGRVTGFQPNADITREQLAVMMMRYANYLGLDTSARENLARYNDVDKLSYGREAVSWAVAEGLISGYDGTTNLGGTDSATRAQASAILVRFVHMML